MKVFIFGAGASYGSQNTSAIENKLRAPLVNQLFDNMYKEYAKDILSTGEWDELENIVKESIASGKSLEKYLTERWQNRENLQQNSSKDAEKLFFGRLTFYIWNLLNKISQTYNSGCEYRTLISKLVSNDEKFGLISFNYDTLLDQAIEERIKTLTTLEDYEKIPYIKPHGSVNWLLPKRATDPSAKTSLGFDFRKSVNIASESIFSGNKLTIKDIRIETPHQLPAVGYHDILPKFDGWYFYPLVLMPLTKKLYPIFEDFYVRTIKEGKFIMQAAKEIYLIGYRGQDEIISELFKSLIGNVSLHVVGTESAKAIQEKVIKGNQHLVAGKTYSNGFANFVKNY